MLVSAILARNEAARDLPDVLDNARSFADKVLLLDDGSTDSTVALAKRKGCLVRKRIGQAMWGQEAPARTELWDWAAEEAGPNGWCVIQDADMILRGDPRPLTRSWTCNTWAFVLYDCWSPTTYRADQFWRGHEFPRPWLFCPSRVPEGWFPKWPDRGLHCGHAPANWPMQACAVGPDVLHWLHRAYCTPQRRDAKYRQYLTHADQLTDFERAHAHSILDPLS